MSKFTVRDLITKPDNRLSERAVLILIPAQTIVIVALCAATGVYFGPKVGLTDSFLTGLSHGNAIWSDLYHQLWIGTIAGVICALIWIVSYYGFIRSRIDPESVLITERLREQIGLATRITSGGITEEIIFRWGLLTVVMWAVSLLTPSQSAAFWIAIVTTGIVFGLAHLPDNIERGCKPSPMLIGSAVLGNLMVSIFCGFLFWQYGLIAAIVVHILFHVMWYLWERVVFKKARGSRINHISIDEV
jgi:membrane protease YdiL (CAAX protease family)